MREVSKGPLKAYVLASVKRGSERDAVRRIQKIKGVTEVLITYGMWDLIVRIETGNLEKLNSIISDIRQLPEIEQTNTLIGTT